MATQLISTTNYTNDTTHYNKISINFSRQKKVYSKEYNKKYVNDNFLLYEIHCNQNILSNNINIIKGSSYASATCLINHASQEKTIKCCGRRENNEKCHHFLCSFNLSVHK